MQSCWKHPIDSRQRAFSLSELLIVIGIIILVLVMAVPALNVLTGSRSIENAINLISANLARARMVAIRDQQPRGLVFYRDATNDRVAVALAGLNPTTGHIDVIPGADVQYLPPGISIAFRHNLGSSTYTYRLDDPVLRDLYGVVMFDSRGQVMHRNYAIKDAELGQRLGISGEVTGYDGANFYSQPAFLLFERALFEDQSFANQAAENDWLESNASVLLINRYNGTLTRSE